MKQKLRKVKGEINKSVMVSGVFNSPLLDTELETEAQGG